MLNNKYISSIFIYDIPKELAFGEFFEMIERNAIYDMAIYISKMDTLKVLKELTYYISSSNAEIKTATDNQIDIDVLNMHKNDAKDLRKEIQINNQEIYKLNIFITLYNKSKEELLKQITELKTKLYSRQIFSNITNFRNLDSYILTLPLNSYENKLIDKTYRNVTTLALCNFFPFYTNTIFDKNGILLGYTKKDNRICNIDIFDDKYLNSNIVILGSSGAGKSFFVKLMILKNYFKNKIQYIFDPEGEYINLANNINAEVISLYNTKDLKCINILDITESEINYYETNILDKKIKDVADFLSGVLALDTKNKEKLQTALLLAYNKKKITNEINSLYKENSGDVVYVNKHIKEKEEFPNMFDVISNIKDAKLKKVLKENVIEKMPYICNYTNINLNTKTTVFDTSKTTNELKEIMIPYLFSKIDIKLKDNKNTQNIIIYIDEIWKYISLNNSQNIESIIYSLYKSIRKNKASIVSITQDITDLFMYQKGSFGKSILNNSAFKVFFKLEFADSEILKKLNAIDDRTLKEMSRLDKRTAIMTLNNNIVTINIKSNDIERKIILGKINEDFSST